MIIVNGKFRQHMLTHNEFVKNYEEYLTKEIKEKILKQCKENFNIIHITYNEIVGNVGIVEVAKNDKVFWAKRKGRNIYSRFVKERNSEKTNIITFVLKEQYNNKGKFNLISMYPSLGKTEKEIFDSNISSLEELERSIDFWTNYAFVGEYEEETDKDIFEVNKCLFSKENYESNTKEIQNLNSEKLYLKNLYYGSETIKFFDMEGDFVQTKCKYTGLKFNYMNNGYEFRIGYAGNQKNEFIEEISLVG